MDVAVEDVVVEGAGDRALLSGGMSLLIGALRLVVGVIHSGTGLMMTQVVGRLLPPVMVGCN